MAEFKPINTQEEFNALIGQRLEEARNAERQKFSDYEQIKTQLADLKKEAEAKDTTITELRGQLKTSRSDLAKTRITLEMGLPQELCSRLTGETEEELRKDAETLSKLLKTARGEPPRFEHENGGNNKDEALKGLLDGIRKQ